MESMNSFRGYGKVDPAEEQAFRKKTRKRIIIIAVSVVLLLAIVVGSVAGTLARSGGSKSSSTSSQVTPSVKSLEVMCSVTEYPDSCFSSISAREEANSTTDPRKLFQISLQVVMDSLQNLSGLPDNWMTTTSDPVLQSALQVCHDVFQDAVDATNDSISLFSNASDNQVDPWSTVGIDDLRTWLSASLTNLDTCIDALVEVNATDATMEEVKTAMSNSTQYASNSLAIVTKFIAVLDQFNIPSNRKLLSVHDSAGSSSAVIDSSGFPIWVKAADRKLLQAPAPAPAAGSPTADVVVAQDGSGDYRTIKEALGKVPTQSNTRFVIYVKAGTYREKVMVEKQMWNVMMIGDGKDKTIVTGAANYVDGIRTLHTATFTVMGKGFIAKNMGFQNSAGAAKHQAVALRSASDQSVFYNCLFDGFQDTLYAHNNRQFYRGCDITGTVDFIFGNAAVIFQGCNIMPRQPDPGQFITLTAQGKNDTNQNTGTVIQYCDIYTFPNDNVTAEIYLGRPWKEYSTAIFAESTIDAPVNPRGWIEWTPDVTPPATIFYGEYENKGPGADVSKRVNWTGYDSSLTASQVAEYGVSTFLKGQSWIEAAQVTFT